MPLPMIIPTLIGTSTTPLGEAKHGEDPEQHEHQPAADKDDVPVAGLTEILSLDAPLRF
jgi:hypothetical protein